MIYVSTDSTPEELRAFRDWWKSVGIDALQILESIRFLQDMARVKNPASKAARLHRAYEAVEFSSRVRLRMKQTEPNAFEVGYAVNDNPSRAELLYDKMVADLREQIVAVYDFQMSGLIDAAQDQWIARVRAMARQSAQHSRALAARREFEKLRLFWLRPPHAERLEALIQYWKDQWDLTGDWNAPNPS